MTELVIEAGHTEKSYWRDFWKYRELFYFLGWRDILVRYKQTVIGIAWAVVRPLLTMLAFTFIFGRLAKLPCPACVPYPLLVFAATLAWQFFAAALSESGNSLVGNANLISKVYFPRLLVPASSILASFIDFLVSLMLMLLLMLCYGFKPGWSLLAFPFFIALLVGVTLGAGLWLCALNVKYRDFRHLVPFIVQVGMYVSPVGFESRVVPEKWQLLYSFNPMVGIIDGFRWSLLRGALPLDRSAILASFAVAVLLLVSGIWYFRRTERTFADVI